MNAFQVKIFSSNDPKGLEKEINDWLANKTGAAPRVLKDIKFSCSVTGEASTAPYELYSALLYFVGPV
ncbi:hypothetical protein [Prosthecobacter sp.]|jgi:hypothetical protein|uniref:hypothetical protein n=1 Tax=Prosthecobacter sp. TaxID=1965333 RepID=UPI0037C8A0CE